MLQRRFLVTTIGLVLCLLTAVAQTAKKNSDYEPILLPSGKHFPTSQSALMKLRDDQDVPGMHSHAWDIFAGLTSKPLPIWETWFTKCDAGVLSPDCDLATRSSQPTSRRLNFLKSFEIPNQVILEFQRAVSIDHQTTFSNRATSDILFSQFLDQFEKRPQFASVLFNLKAKNHIRNQNLYTHAGIDAVYTRRANLHSPNKEFEIDPFPNGSVVLKTTWALVYDLGGVPPVLFIPNQDVLNATRAAGNNQSIRDPSEWGTHVTIDTLSNTQCRDQDYLPAANTSTPIVPLDCFYFYKFNTIAEARAFPAQLGQLTGDKSIIVGHTFLVLVAVHAITKETPDWVWTTFWWQNKANQAPASVQGNRWRHFMMDTTLSTTTPFEPAPDGGSKICFNPYLEAQFPNGIVSNCVQCHEHAVYSPKDQSAKIQEGLDLGSPWRDGTPANNRPKNCHYFDGAMRTDFMWSLATQQDPSITAFLNGLREYLQSR
jgi:hypothetical protein